MANHPEMLETIKNLLDITEGVNGIEIADEAEFALIPEVRGLGKNSLEDWAKQQTQEKEELAQKKKLKKTT